MIEKPLLFMFNTITAKEKLFCLSLFSPLDRNFLFSAEPYDERMRFSVCYVVHVESYSSEITMLPSFLKKNTDDHRVSRQQYF